MNQYSTTPEYLVEPLSGKTAPMEKLQDCTSLTQWDQVVVNLDSSRKELLSVIATLDAIQRDLLVLSLLVEEQS